jgi:L-2-hydroxyglutarate oxidase
MSIKKISTDFLIVGGGVIGLTIARALSIKYPNTKIDILEKEYKIAYHATGRNSGVLHAGFYYTSDSLRAAYCRKGNRAWTQYCE